jgi:hypothetical protein
VRVIDHLHRQELQDQELLYVFISLRSSILATASRLSSADLSPPQTSAKPSSTATPTSTTVHVSTSVVSLPNPETHPPLPRTGKGKLYKDDSVIASVSLFARFSVLQETS